MTSLSRTHLVLSFLALMALRLAVGYHFYDEGVSKLKEGNFSSESFLASAKGPLAPYYRMLMDDEDGSLRLCLAPPAQPARPRPDLAVPFAIWDDFVEQAKEKYQFADDALITVIEARRAENASRVRSASRGEDASHFEAQMEEDRLALEQLRAQQKRANEILEHHKRQLRQLLTTGSEPALEYHDELIKYFQGRERLDGFAQDGASRQVTSIEVPSLREQVDAVRAERAREIRPWLNDVELIWDSLENQINDLAVDIQVARGPVQLHRPFRQSYSPQSIIDLTIPWFDIVVGGLLLVGLFTRIASLAGAILLAGVIASQPMFFPGAMPTTFPILELLALLVLFATCAGRYGGLDWFIHRLVRKEPGDQTPDLLP